MKPSGIDWIGDIPSAWDVKRIKYVIQNNADGIKVGPFGSALTNEVVGGEEGQYKIYGQANLIRKDFDYGDNYVTEENYRRLINYEVLPEDIAVSMMGTIGKCSVVPYGIKPGIMDSHLIKIRLSNKMLPRFFEYIYESCVVYEQLVVNSKGSIMNGLNSSIVKSVFLAVPSTEEQQVIADFLDVQCSKLDSIIADLEKQIDTLQKYKKSLITETVTKGLDKTASMKDSGIEWIGKIPEHWEVKKFSYECERIGDIDHYMPDSVDEGIPYVMTGDFIGEGNDIDFENCKQISRQDYLRLSRKMKPMINDILFARYATIGTVRIVDTDKEFLVSYSCAIIRVKETLFSKYVFYYLKSGAFYEEISKYINTNTQGNVGIDSIGRAKIPLPPVSEQELIADFLDEKCTQIDELLQIKQSQLNSIKRHKKSLIYEYVTGKKRVQEVK